MLEGGNFTDKGSRHTDVYSFPYIPWIVSNRAWLLNQSAFQLKVKGYATLPPRVVWNKCLQKKPKKTRTKSTGNSCGLPQLVTLVCVDKPSIHLPRLPLPHVFVLFGLMGVSASILFMLFPCFEPMYTRCPEPDSIKKLSSYICKQYYGIRLNQKCQLCGGLYLSPPTPSMADHVQVRSDRCPPEKPQSRNVCAPAITRKSRWLSFT